MKQIYILLLLFIAPLAAVAADSYEVKGTNIDVVNEDFSKFKTGSLGSPDETWVSDPQTFKIDESYTNMPGWGGIAVRPAGGYAYIGLYEDEVFGEDTGVIETPLFDSNEYTYTITFRVKSESSTGDEFTVSYDYYDPSSSEKMHLSKEVFNIDDSWKELTCKVNGRRGMKTFFTLYAKAKGVYLDDIKVSAFKTDIDEPASLSWSDYTGTSFTAHWSASEGADSYLLSVYSMNGDNKNFVLQDKEVKETQANVKGLDPNKVYYFNVRGKNSATYSPLSATVEVNELLVPVLNDAATNADGFVASWSASPRAEAYDFWAYRQHYMKEAQTVVLAESGFDEIVSEGTMLDPIYPEENDTIQTIKSMPGWTAQYQMYLNGAVGLNSFYTIFNKYPQLQSPEYDLSASGGVVTVDVDVSSYDNIMLALFNYVDGKWVNVNQVDLLGAPADDTSWVHHSQTLTGGSSRSIISIFSSGMGWSFFDNLKVSINAEAGSHFLVPMVNEVVENTSLKVDADMSEGNSYACKVRAIANGGVIASEFTELRYVGASGSVDTSLAAYAEAFIANGVLNIVNPENLPVYVYNANGNLVSTSASPTIELSALGVYIVKIGSKVCKVVK